MNAKRLPPREHQSKEQFGRPACDHLPGKYAFYWTSVLFFCCCGLFLGFFIGIILIVLNFVRNVIRIVIVMIVSFRTEYCVAKVAHTNYFRTTAPDSLPPSLPYFPPHLHLF